jgi:hypothetical protein
MEKRKFFTLPALELQPLGRPARSQSLYRHSKVVTERRGGSRTLRMQINATYYNTALATTCGLVRKHGIM